MLVYPVRVTSQISCGDIIMPSQKKVLDDDMGDRWLFLEKLCVKDMKLRVGNEIIHSLPWKTIFGSPVMRFTNDFHSWLRHSWRSLANHLTRDQKIVIHDNSCIILYVFIYIYSPFSHSPSLVFKWITYLDARIVIWTSIIITILFMLCLPSVLKYFAKLRKYKTKQWHKFWYSNVLHSTQFHDMFANKFKLIYL